MFNGVMSRDQFEEPYKRSCYTCQIKYELIERGRYILVCDSLSGFSLELFFRQDFINFGPDFKLNVPPLSKLLCNITN